MCVQLKTVTEIYLNINWAPAGEENSNVLSVLFKQKCVICVIQTPTELLQKRKIQMCYPCYLNTNWAPAEEENSNVLSVLFKQNVLFKHQLSSCRREQFKHVLCYFMGNKQIDLVLFQHLSKINPAFLFLKPFWTLQIFSRLVSSSVFCCF